MECLVTSALCALSQMFVVELQKLEEERKLLLALYEMEESNMKYSESLVKNLLMEVLSRKCEDNSKPSFNPLFEGSNFSSPKSNMNNLVKGGPNPEVRTKGSRRNVYIPKYVWTENRTQRLLDSVQRHYCELLENKDFAKPIWEIIRTEVDSIDPHLKWYTCRHKWSHLSADYSNYIKDLSDYTNRSSAPELTVYVPQYYEQIGTILRKAGDQRIAYNQGSPTQVVQKVLEDRIGEALKNTTWEELGKREEDDELITVTGVNFSFH